MTLLLRCVSAGIELRTLPLRPRLHYIKHTVHWLYCSGCWFHLGSAYLHIVILAYNYQVLSWYLTLHWQYSHRQYNKVGKSFQNSKVNGEGAVVGKSPVGGLAPCWIEGWLLPGLVSFKIKKKKKGQSWIGLHLFDDDTRPQRHISCFSQVGFSQLFMFCKRITECRGVVKV